jgi:hypothetical protein
MDTTTMTNTDEITIFDEIVNCGILEDDTVVNFGAGHQEGKFLETLLDYNGTLGNELITAVEPNKKRIKSLSKKFKGESVSYFEGSLQEYIDSEHNDADWTVITGVFDSGIYENNQFSFINEVVQNSLEYSRKGVIFTIRITESETLRYYDNYLFTEFVNSYDKFTVKKFGDGNYVFCIFKQ